MSDRTAAELFADDIMRIVMERLSVRLQPKGVTNNGASPTVEVIMVDNATGLGVRCSGPDVKILPSPGVVLEDGTVRRACPTQG